MIFTKVTIDGTEFSDYTRARVTRSIDLNNSISNFDVLFDSPFGRHSSDFSVGQEIIIYADNTDATNKLFTGVVERVAFKGKENTQTVTLKGRDYSLRLQDTTVEPIVYTNTEISVIVKDIIQKAVDDITVVNVNVTPTTLQRITFNHTSVFQSLKQLAELAGFYFYVDEDKDLHFKLNNNISSGITLDNTNIKKSIFNQTREGMANDIYVYGDRALAGYEETFIAGSPVGGSSFILESKPRNTLINVDNVIQRGGVYQLITQPSSGATYLVSFNDKEIIFVSGTNLGYDAVPASGASVLIQYDRDIPILRSGQDRTSIALYGKKTKVINDKSINDPTTAKAILDAELLKADPFKGVECDIKGWYDITPGNTAVVTLSDFGLNETIGILDVNYIFDKNSIQSEDVIKIRLDKKIKDITDEITDIRSRVNAIEEADRQETDLLTRQETAENNLFVVGSYWEVITRTLTGSTLVLSDSVITFSDYTLASGTDQKPLSGDAYGEAYGANVIVASGGFF